MSGALHEDTLRAVLDEARRQGWRLTPSPDGARWRGDPPDGGKAVLFSARPSVLSPVIRQLQDRGFVWPPRHVADNAVVRAAPFPPAPHPDVDMDDAPPPPRSTMTLVKAQQIPQVPVVSLDAAFAALKQASEYVGLARDELRDAKAAADAARAVEASAQAAYDDAIRERAKCKGAFDALVGEP
jgi:hypothetical protein